MSEPAAPEAGDLVWIDLDPVAGTEQAGRRPVLVISIGEYNELTGRMVALPITGRSRGWPTEVHLPPGVGIEGVVLTDQVRTLDWRRRAIKPAGKGGAETLAEARAKLALILGLDA